MMAYQSELLPLSFEDVLRRNHDINAIIAAAKMRIVAAFRDNQPTKEKFR